MKSVMTLFTILASTLAINAHAANHTVKMLNNGPDGIMVFDPPYLKAAKGDTVKFVPADPSHEVASVAIPKNAKAFKGAVDKEVSVKLTEEGVYLYDCNTHLAMAMVGVIQVGKPTNLDDVKKAGKDLSAKFVMNKERLDKYLAQVK